MNFNRQIFILMNVIETLWILKLFCMRTNTAEQFELECY